MKARRVIEGVSFGPDALKTIRLAFQKAWAEVERNFGTDARTVEDARLRLAEALLSIASDDSRDVEVLKQAALERMALDYRNTSN
jgi:hypothetical protein